MASLFQDVRNVVGGGVSMLGTAMQIPGTGIKLPEFGISEMIQGKPVQAAAPQGQVQGTMDYNANLQPQMNVSTPGITSGGSGGGGAGNASALQDIEAAYNANIQSLSNQAGETQAQYGTAGERLTSQYGEAGANIADTQKKQIGQLTESGQTVGASSQSAIAQARQAYNELQQKNNAYTSALGISSSSASEAMQENLSKNTLQALNNIAQNRDTSLQNLEKEKANTNDFYQRQQAGLQTALVQAKEDIQNQMNAALNRINEAKTLAGNQKQQARNSVIAQAQAAYSAASAQGAQYQAGLDAFNTTKNSILGTVAGYAQGTVSIQGVLDAFTKTNQQLSKQGVQIDVPTVLGAMNNPYAAATVGSSWFVPATSSKGSLQTINGKQVWVDDQGNVTKQY